MDCGSARIEITPTFPVPLFGYPGVARVFEPHKDRVIDPLHARAVHLRQGDGPGVLLVVLDLCILTTRDAGFLRGVLAAATGLPVPHVWVACTHTHSAPLARFTDAQDPGAVEDGFVSDPGATARRYGEWLLPRIRKVATLARSRRSPAGLSHRETFSGAGYDRRCVTADGVRNCWNPVQFPDRVPAPARGPRHSVLRIDYTGKPGGILLQSAGIHPVVMGGQSQQVSADWPGMARRHIEKRLGGYQALMFEGAAAQVQPWISTQADPRALRVVGEAIAAEALLLAAAGAALETGADPLTVRHFTVADRAIEIAAFGLGRLLVLGLPFELSTVWASRIVEALGRPVFFICLCNGWDGYWMAPDEFAEGGYEIEVAHAKGVGPRHSLDLLEGVRALAR